jgi:hypothetical protein
MLFSLMLAFLGARSCSSGDIEELGKIQQSPGGDDYPAKPNFSLSST